MTPFLIEEKAGSRCVSVAGRLLRLTAPLRAASDGLAQAVFYNHVGAGEVGKYKLPEEISATEAQAGNPDPKSMVPVVVVGFKQLRERAAAQRAFAQELTMFVTVRIARAPACRASRASLTFVRVRRPRATATRAAAASAGAARG